MKHTGLKFKSGRALQRLQESLPLIGLICVNASHFTRVRLSPIRVTRSISKH